MSAAGIPPLTKSALFLRFLRFGALAWGGPVAQIAMLQRQLVEKERWISMERFHRALALLYLVRHELQVVLVMGCAALAGWLLL